MAVADSELGKGLVLRQRDPDDGRRLVYQLTGRGKSLFPVLLAMRDWGLAQIPGTSMRDFAAMRAATEAARPLPGSDGAVSTLARPAPRTARKASTKAKGPQAVGQVRKS